MRALQLPLSPLSFSSFSLHSLQLIIIIFRGRYWRGAIVWILSGLHGIINTTYVVPYTLLSSSFCTPFSLSLLLLLLSSLVGSLWAALLLHLTWLGNGLLNGPVVVFD